MVFRQVLESVLFGLLFAFLCSDSVCDLRFKPEFSFHSLGFVLVNIFPCCVILQRNKKQFLVSFSSWFEDCVVASVARKEVFLHKFL
jgi:hypothetical protein